MKALGEMQTSWIRYQILWPFLSHPLKLHIDHNCSALCLAQKASIHPNSFSFFLTFHVVFTRFLLPPSHHYSMRWFNLPSFSPIQGRERQNYCNRGKEPVNLAKPEVEAYSCSGRRSCQTSAPTRLFNLGIFPWHCIQAPKPLMAPHTQRWHCFKRIHTPKHAQREDTRRKEEEEELHVVVLPPWAGPQTKPGTCRGPSWGPRQASPSPGGVRAAREHTGRSPRQPAARRIKYSATTKLTNRQ